VLLTSELQRLQHLLGESARSGLQRGVVWAELEFHHSPLGVSLAASIEAAIDGP
jgi:hypothetical protein